MREFYLSLVVLATVISAGLAITCHQCDSRSDLGCLDPYDGVENEGNMDDCGDMETHCTKFKIVERVYDSGNILGDPTVTYTGTRACAQMDFTGDRCDYITSASGIMYVCYCDTDGCNNGPNLTSNWITTILTLIASLYFIRKFV